MFLISIYLEEYKKVELSALQCLSVSLFRNSNGQAMKSVSSQSSKLLTFCVLFPRKLQVLVSSSCDSLFWLQALSLDHATAKVFKPQEKPILDQAPADSSRPSSPGKRTLLTLRQLFN
ncbi:hypothetical protein ATANTOWER_029213 [Ataeniobius toweri]|uniref:Uncharacterized protein n=1 Tax=Ataeniobius toweri TaxID=208326 RepID=A0ABU7BVK2_9TELE|nr:hypothetical protein [Ataeniobius toweri]